MPSNVTSLSAHTPAKANLLGILFGLIGFTLFVITDSLRKEVVSRYEPQMIVFVVAVVSALTLFFWALSQGNLSNLIPQKPRLAVLRGLAIGSLQFFAVSALKTLPLAEFYAIVFTAPLFFTLLCWMFLGDKVGWIRGLAILAGFAGVLIFARPGTEAFSIGGGFTLLAAISFGLAAFMVRFAKGGDKPLAMSFSQVIVVVVVGVFVAFPVLKIPAPIDAVIMVVIGILTAAASLFLVKSQSIATTAAAVAPVQYSQIVTGVLIGWLFFGDIPNWDVLLGAGVIIASGLVLIWRESR